MPSMLVQMPSMGYRNQYRRAEMVGCLFEANSCPRLTLYLLQGGCYYEPALSLPVLQAVQVMHAVTLYTYTPTLFANH